jgi:hypothetical protein
MTASTVAAMDYFLITFIMRKLLLLLITDGVDSHHPNYYIQKKVYGSSLIHLQFVIP